MCAAPSPSGQEAWLEHLLGHVVREGAGFTWSCKCGATRHDWSSDRKAAAALSVHMVREHGYHMPTPQLAAAMTLADGYEGVK